MPWVVDDKILIQDIMNCTNSGDHRYGDAAAWISIYNIEKDYMTDAANFNPANHKDQGYWDEQINKN